MFWKLERAVILAVAALAIAIATALVALVALQLQHAQPGEPMFTGVATEQALAWALPSAIVTFPFLLWSLLRTRLDRSLPLVFAVAVVATPLAMLVVGVHGIWIGFLCSLSAMWFCRQRFRHEPAPPPA